jgi:hypothetical protein
VSDRGQGSYDGPERDAVDRPPPPRQPKPAGWYRDPSGKYDWRYFDGSWTDDVANEGDDRTYTDPVPSQRTASSPSPQQPPEVSLEQAASPKLGKRRLLKLPLWLWAGAGVIAIIAIASSSGDEPESAVGSRPDNVTSPAAADPAGTSGAAPAAGEADESDDVRSCALVDSETITIDLHNNSSGTSSYTIDVTT